MNNFKKGQLVKTTSRAALFSLPAPRGFFGWRCVKAGKLLVVIEDSFDMWSVVKVYSQDLGIQGWVAKNELKDAKTR